jgi:hypothetical protein
MPETEKKQEAKPETVVFWMWQEVDPESTPKKVRAVPSKMFLAVSGGELLTDKDGRKYRNPFKEIRFDNGCLRTSDPEIIAAVLKLTADGERNIVEDEAEYLRHVAEPLSLKKTTAQLESAKKENQDLRAINAELNRKLNETKLELAEDKLEALVGGKAAAGV